MSQRWVISYFRIKKKKINTDRKSERSLVKRKPY